MSVYINGKFYSMAFKNKNNLTIGELKFVSTSSNLILKSSSNVIQTDENKEENKVDDEISNFQVN